MCRLVGELAAFSKELGYIFLKGMVFILTCPELPSRDISIYMGCVIKVTKYHVFVHVFIQIWYNIIHDATTDQRYSRTF